MIGPGQEVVIGFKVTYSVTRLGHDVFILPWIEREFKFRPKTISPQFLLSNILCFKWGKMTRVGARDGNTISLHTRPVEFTLNRSKN